jgi:hypothetical protein
MFSAASGLLALPCFLFGQSYSIIPFTTYKIRCGKGGGGVGNSEMVASGVKGTRTPESGSGHTPPMGKARGSMKAFIKICN